MNASPLSVAAEVRELVVDVDVGSRPGRQAMSTLLRRTEGERAWRAEEKQDAASVVLEGSLGVVL